MLRNTAHWLSLDLASAATTIAIHKCEIGKEPSLLADLEVGHAQQSCERLLPSMDQLLKRYSIKLSDIDLMILPDGPGSFTGHRIAFSTVKAFAMALNKPIETIHAAEARALAWLDQKTVMHLSVITRVTIDKYVRSVFKVNGPRSVDFVSESIADQTRVVPNANEILLMDDPAQSSHQGHQIFFFPLRATQLGECRPYANTLRTYSTIEEWIKLRPTYVGTTKFCSTY